MSCWEDPELHWVYAGVGSEHGELGVFKDESGSFSFSLEDVAESAFAVFLVEFLGFGHLVFHDFWNRRSCDQLAVSVGERCASFKTVVSED